MRDDNSYSGAHLLLAFVAGAVAGACVTLLTAPQSGSETRESLRGWARDTQAGAARLPQTLSAAYHSATAAAKQAFNRALHDKDEAAVSEPNEPPAV
jgi:gas vesicle protein